jgi:hypothetical protein
VIAPRLGGPRPESLLGPRGLDALRDQIDRYRDTVLDKL